MYFVFGVRLSSHVCQSTAPPRLKVPLDELGLPSTYASRTTFAVPVVTMWKFAKVPCGSALIDAMQSCEQSAGEGPALTGTGPNRRRSVISTAAKRPKRATTSRNDERNPLPNSVFI